MTRGNFLVKARAAAGFQCELFGGGRNGNFSSVENIHKVWLWLGPTTVRTVRHDSPWVTMATPPTADGTTASPLSFNVPPVLSFRVLIRGAAKGLGPPPGAAGIVVSVVEVGCPPPSGWMDARKSKKFFVGSSMSSPSLARRAARPRWCRVTCPVPFPPPPLFHLTR
jgi:hypothetical protein